MLSPDELAAILAGLPVPVLTHVRMCMRYGWPLEAERALAAYLDNPVQAKAVIAAWVREEAWAHARGERPPAAE